MWDFAAMDAKRIAQEFLPGVEFTASVQDYGRGPILDVSTPIKLPLVMLDTLDYAVSSLGWRGWGYGEQGIAFKPTFVNLG